MADKPSYATVPVLALARITASVTTRDGTGATVVYTSSAANGVRVQRLIAKAQGTTTAGTLAIYLSDGTNSRLATEILVTAGTAGATAATWESSLDWGNTGLWLPTGSSLRATVTGATAATLTSPIDLVLLGAIA